MSDSIQYTATTPRVEISAHLTEAVVATATALLTSERRSSFKAEGLSVGAVWARRDNSSAFGQMRRAPTLALVKALRLAHDDAPDPVLWPTPKEALKKGAPPNSGVVAAAIGGTATVEVVTPGVEAARVGETGKMVGVVATTTAAGVARVVEAREERRVLVVAHSAAKGATRPEPTGAAGAERSDVGGGALRTAGDAPSRLGIFGDVMSPRPVGVFRPRRPASRGGRSVCRVVDSC